MDTVLIFLLGAAAGVTLGLWLRRGRTSPEPDSTNQSEKKSTSRSRLYEMAQELNDVFERTAQPADIEDNPDFGRAVQLLVSDEFSTADLLGYYTGDNQLIACLALEALRQRGDAEINKSVLAGINNVSPWTAFFAFRVLQQAAEPVLADVLARLQDHWQGHLYERMLRDFVLQRCAVEDEPVLGDRIGQIDGDQRVWLAEFLKGLDALPAAALAVELEHWQKNRVDVDFLRSFGRVWDAEVTGQQIVTAPYLDRWVSEIETELRQTPPRSVLLAGEAGVGKTTALRLLARKLLVEGWVVFEAGAVELLAGQSYYGQLEERLQRLAQTLSSQGNVLWVVPDLHELAWAGRHRHSTTSVLDFFLPHIESGSILLIGEVQPAALAQLIQAKPQLRGAATTLQMSALPDAETLQLARDWVAVHTPAGGPAPLSDARLHEAFHLAQQYLGDKVAPGNLLHLLRTTREYKEQIKSRSNVIERQDLVTNLSRLTGLPAAILDERAGLDLEALRTFFCERVMGQEEAISCLVDRIALIKAGLTDPTRPLGVFLFCGPTGTGKTEIAKTLAEYLFGTADRMIRLDMSEFQGPSSLTNILGEADEQSTQTALVHLIRKQPFSVVLLDEFEKAHGNVWDLFLQVFDDGRLTDRRGNVANFRHSIVIMTSNLGSKSLHDFSIGFGAGGEAGWREDVQKALDREFRPEFINRIDRVVVFRTLSREVMRAVLQKELASVLSRRGLRNRQWAVEWDESALEFLLAKGFSPLLGARPLKRAIERYLLSPLATAIVNHQVPEGDQFLFIGSDGQTIDVAFVDPDAPEPEKLVEVPTPADHLRVETIALDGQGTAAELSFLESLFARLHATAAEATWRETKQAGMAAMSEADFWGSADRFAVLSRIEYMDRVESGLATAQNLLRRLRGSGDKPRTQFAHQPVRRLAEQLYLLERCMTRLPDGVPHDAFVRVETASDAAADTIDFAHRIAAMYRGWVKKRRMHLDILEDVDGVRGGGPFRTTVGVAGYAAHDLLQAENGLHVLEAGENPKDVQRHRVRVLVARQPEGPPPHDQEARRAIADRVLDEQRAERPAIVRRYREHPSPLVRDGVRGWRTGRLERVLAGDFDLMT